ncbi:MAG: hypothetical protein ISS44_01920 [Candidatus Omnitrophica bacterium]|nr:hypothetical protein [Candidatus Omnitrophota bacterium]
MRRRCKGKGQSTLEYAILIAVIVAGLIAMQVYLKRGYQGRLRSSVDDIGEQYSPGYTTSEYTTVRESSMRDTVKEGVTRSELLEPEKVTRTGSETVADFDSEYWK